MQILSLPLNNPFGWSFDALRGRVPLPTLNAGPPLLMTKARYLTLLLDIASNTDTKSQFILLAKYILLVSNTRVIIYWLLLILIQNLDLLKLYSLYSRIPYYSFIFLYKVYYSYIAAGLFIVA